MSPVLVLALLIVAGLAATRLLRVMPRQVDLRVLRAAGTPLLVLGVLLGPVSGVLNDGTQRVLAPVMALGLGWLGATFGGRLQWRFVRSIPRTFWAFSAVQTAAAFLAVAVGGTLLAAVVPALRADWRPFVPIVLTLGAVAAVSEPITLLRASADRVPYGVTKSLGIAATLSTLLGVLAFTLVLAIYLPRGSQGFTGAISWVLLSLGSGVVLGVLFLSLPRLRESQGILVALPGTILFGAGAAHAAGLSPFVVCAVAAAVICSRSPERSAVATLLGDWEPTIYPVILILAGALLGMRTLWIVPAAVVLAALRIGARWAAGRYGRRVTAGAGLPPHAGLAGIPQGGVALALGINFLLLYRDSAGPAADAVFITVAIGIVVTQLAAPYLMHHALRVAELTPSPAPAEVT